MVHPDVRYVGRKSCCCKNCRLVDPSMLGGTRSQGTGWSNSTTESTLRACYSHESWTSCGRGLWTTVNTYSTPLELQTISISSRSQFSVRISPNITFDSSAFTFRLDITLELQRSADWRLSRSCHRESKKSGTARTPWLRPNSARSAMTSSR